MYVLLKVNIQDFLTRYLHAICPTHCPKEAFRMRFPNVCGKFKVLKPEKNVTVKLCSIKRKLSELTD